MFRLRVLVAENNRPSLNLYRDILTKMGHEVEIATNGAQAWEAYCQSPFHAVLVDYRLPGINGEEFFDKVRRRSPDVDVVLLTGNASIDKILNLVEMGATDYLVKPVDPKRLRDMFEKVAMKQKLLYDATSMADQLSELPPVDGGAAARAPAPTPTSPSAPTTSSDADEARRLRSRLSTLEEELSEARYFQARSRELTSQLEEAERQRRKLEEERDDLRLSVDQLRSGAEDAGPAGASAPAAVLRELERARARVEELGDQVKRRSEDLEALDEQSKRRERELSDLEQSRGRLKDALEREKGLTAARQEEVERLNAALTELREQLEKARSSSGRPGVAGADAEAQRRHEAQVAELNAQLASREASLKGVRKELESLRAAAAARDESVTFLKEKLKSRTEKLNALKDAARLLEAENIKFQQDAQSKEDEARRFAARLEERERALAALTVELQSRDARVKELTAEVGQRDGELLKARSAVHQTGDELGRAAEERLKRTVSSLTQQGEQQKAALAVKEEELQRARAEAAAAREGAKHEVEGHALARLRLEEELQDLREVLSEREQLLSRTLAQREDEYQSLLKQREGELAVAREGGTAEVQRLEQELLALKREQRGRELQQELSSEWMELGEALVLLDEELKKKEADLVQAKEDFAKKEKAYEGTIANQRRKFKELEESVATASAGGPAGGEPGESGGVRARLAGLVPARLELGPDGTLVKFDARTQEYLGMDENRRPGRTRLAEVPSGKQLRPLIERLQAGAESAIERPLWLRSPGKEPRPFWGLARKVSDAAGPRVSLELYDVSECHEVLASCDFSDARITFQAYDATYERSLKIKETLFSMRIVFEILQKKFKSNPDVKSMVDETVAEYNKAIELVQEL